MFTSIAVLIVCVLFSAGFLITTFIAYTEEAFSMMFTLALGSVILLTATGLAIAGVVAAFS